MTTELAGAPVTCEAPFQADSLVGGLVPDQQLCTLYSGSDGTMHLCLVVPQCIVLEVLKSGLDIPVSGHWSGKDLLSYVIAFSPDPTNVIDSSILSHFCQFNDQLVPPAFSVSPPDHECSLLCWRILALFPS